MKHMAVPRPFIKWAGGKTRILPALRKYYPEHIRKYCEPFVGAGAVLFDIIYRYTPEIILINDINKELINTYRQIQQNCEALIDMLFSLQIQYEAIKPERRNEFYITQRTIYNTLHTNEEENLTKAALFIFLNKTCFNGLYRVNSKGMFNVPFNYCAHPCICDADNLRRCSHALQNVVLKSGDFSVCQSFIDTQTFVYIDPPYRPISKTAAFTTYTKTRFGDREQYRLAHFINELAYTGVPFLLSNSDPKNTNTHDTFFDVLYADFSIERIQASRVINSVAAKRGKVFELLISNIPYRLIG